MFRVLAVLSRSKFLFLLSTFSIISIAPSQVQADSAITVTLSGISSGTLISGPTLVQVSATAPANTPITEFDVLQVGDPFKLWEDNPFNGWEKTPNQAICGAINVTPGQDGNSVFTDSCMVIPVIWESWETEPQAIQAYAYTADHTSVVSTPIAVSYADGDNLGVDYACTQQVPSLAAEITKLQDTLARNKDLSGMLTAADATKKISALQALHDQAAILVPKLQVYVNSVSLPGPNHGSNCVALNMQEIAAQNVAIAQQILSTTTQAISQATQFLNSPQEQKAAQDTVACNNFLGASAPHINEDLLNLPTLEAQIAGLVSQSDAANLIKQYNTYGKTVLDDTNEIASFVATNSLCQSKLSDIQSQLSNTSSTLQKDLVTINQFKNSPALQKAALAKYQATQLAQQKAKAAAAAAAKEQNQANASYYYNLGYKAILNNNNYGLLQSGFYLYLNSSNVMTSGNALNFCVHYVQLVMANAVSMFDSMSSAEIDSWVSGCAKAAVKVKHN